MQPVAPSMAGPYALRQPAGSVRAIGGVERYVLGLVLLATYYYTIPILKTPWGYTSYPTLDDFASLLFCVVSLSAITSRVRSIETGVFRLLLLAALLVMPSALLSYLGSPSVRTLRYGVWLGLHYWKMFAIFAAAAVLVMDERRFRRVLQLVWAGSVFVGVYALLQYVGVLSIRTWVEAFADRGPWTAGLEESGPLALGPLSFNHAVMGNYMVVAVMISFAIVRTAPPVMKLLAQLSIPFFLAISILSGSRAGLAGVVVGLIVYLVLSKVRPAAIIAALCGFVVLYVVIQGSPELQDRFVLSKGGKSIAEFSSGRLAGWIKLIEYTVEHPYTLLIGGGLGHTYAAFYSGEIPLVAAHNNYLHWLIEFGFFGLLLALTVLVRLLKIFHAMFGADRFHREIGVAFCSLIVALMWVATTEENFAPLPGMGRVGAYLAFLSGAALALQRTRLLRSVAAYPAALRPAQARA
jgi:O-antigen ligase